MRARAIWVRDPISSFRKTLRRWFSIVFSVTNSAWATSRLVMPSAAIRATRDSLAVSVLRLSIGSRRGRAPAAISSSCARPRRDRSRAAARSPPANHASPDGREGMTNREGPRRCSSPKRRSKTISNVFGKLEIGSRTQEIARASTVASSDQVRVFGGSTPMRAGRTRGEDASRPRSSQTWGDNRVPIQTTRGRWARPDGAGACGSQRAGCVPAATGSGRARQRRSRELDRSHARTRAFPTSSAAA